MKKCYIKPQIEFNSLMLSSNIAGDCEKYANHAQFDCPYKIPSYDGKTIFNQDNCDFNNKFNGICYHDTNNNNNVFLS